MSALKVNKDVTFSIFGCCVTQDICSDFKHIRAAGLTNWISIASGRVSDNIVVAAVVQDTSGSNMSNNTYERLKNLGMLGFTRESARTYVFLKIGSNVLLDVVSEIKDEPTERSINYKGTDIKLGSFSYRNGNTSYISIQDKEYSLKKRGINFAIFTLEDLSCLSSFSYDSHSHTAVLWLGDIERRYEAL